MINDFFSNGPIVAAILAWFIAQVLKVVLVYIEERRFDAERMFGSGGMPSSHSAFVLALTTAIGRAEGVDSTIFALSMAFAVIVMYDAANVRRAAGLQASLLNQIVEDIYHGQQVDQGKLKELLGHTPIEVGAGALLGLCIGLLIS